MVARFMRGTHGRHLLPHRQLAPLREALLALAEYFRSTALVVEFHSPTWAEAADALDAAAEALRRVAR